MKKLLALLLALSLLVFAGGCGGIQTGKDASSSLVSSMQNGESLSSAVQSEKPEEDPWYTTDVTFTEDDLKAAKATKYVKPKNVIFMIGDGMGLNDIAIANKFSDFKFDIGLVLDQLPNRGFATTRSNDNAVTDSAASATALATGFKTNNGYIGKDPQGQDLLNISEIARSLNKRIGIVTSDLVTGATPSAFSVHNISRNNTAELAGAFLKMRPDVLIGNGYSDFVGVAYADDEHRNLFNSVNRASTFGSFETVLNKDKTNSKPFFGFTDFSLKSGDYRLAQCTQIALRRLENENGFFLMVENAGTDKAGHSNNRQGKVDNVAVFDKAVAVAVKYCIEHPDTILIVTSDHETGGVVLPNGDNYTLDDVAFTTTSHSAADVGVFALGYGTEYFNGKTVDNIDIAKFAISAVKGELK